MAAHESDAAVGRTGIDIDERVGAPCHRAKAVAQALSLIPADDDKSQGHAELFPILTARSAALR